MWTRLYCRKDFNIAVLCYILTRVFPAVGRDLIENVATQNGNDNGNGENIIAYIVVFEPKYTLLHLICLFKYSCFFQTYP
jgi:hypothetical protein